MSRPVIGVLALQGGFAKHIEMLQKLDVDVIEVRRPSDLDSCQGLIIPGGESTVMTRQINFINMKESLQKFAETKPIFGTCAGLILLSKEIKGGDVFSLKLLDICVERNAYGRQIDSFLTNVQFESTKKSLTIPAVFIRAPRIKKVSSNVKVLAYFENEPIAVLQGHYLGITFHPELTNDLTIHKFFIQMVNNFSSSK